MAPLSLALIETLSKDPRASSQKLTLECYIGSKLTWDQHTPGGIYTPSEYLQFQSFSLLHIVSLMLRPRECQKQKFYKRNQKRTEDLLFHELSRAHDVKILKNLFFLSHLINCPNYFYFSFMLHLVVFKLKMAKLLDLHCTVDKNSVQRLNTLQKVPIITKNASNKNC